MICCMFINMVATLRYHSKSVCSGHAICKFNKNFLSPSTSPKDRKYVWNRVKHLWNSGLWQRLHLSLVFGISANPSTTASKTGVGFMLAYAYFTNEPIWFLMRLHLVHVPPKIANRLSNHWPSRDRTGVPWLWFNCRFPWLYYCSGDAWAPRHLKSLITRLFVQWRVMLTTKKTSKLCFGVGWGWGMSPIPLTPYHYEDTAAFWERWSKGGRGHQCNMLIYICRCSSSRLLCIMSTGPAVLVSFARCPVTKRPPQAPGSLGRWRPWPP